MKTSLLIPLALVLVAAHGHAQTSIWRCGNTYTNNTAEAKAQGCKLVEGGNVTVVEGTRVNVNAAVRVASVNPSPATAPGGQPGQRVDANEQKARDADAKHILETELKKAETRQTELAREFNKGEPEKLGPETRNHQKYLDRVADLKAGMARNESDLAGLRRELGRLSSATSASK